MRRLLVLLSVVAVMAAMLVVMAVPAFASPAGPGPNSSEAFSDSEGQNFGHCQSQSAKGPGSAEAAQVLNPALFTKGDETFGFGVSCPKAPK